MIVKSTNQKKEIKTNLRDGVGDVTMTHLVSNEQMQHSRLMANLSLPPGASIGDHEHDKETEYYFILNGEGLVNDNGIEKAVSKGDVVITGGGERHSIKNTGKTPLELIAVIILH